LAIVEYWSKCSSESVLFAINIFCYHKQP